MICQPTAALPLRALAVVTWSACVPDGRSSFHDLFPSGGPAEDSFDAMTRPRGICQQSRHYDWLI